MKVAQTLAVTLLLGGSFAPATAEAAEELVIHARLMWKAESLLCGVLHAGAVMEYEVLQVISGTYFGERIFVAHGCPEIPRAQYYEGSGTLEELRLFDVHRLVLGGPAPEGVDVVFTLAREEHFFWCKRVDLVPPK